MGKQQKENLWTGQLDCPLPLEMLEEKLIELKKSQPSTNSSSRSYASKGDLYAQVIGEDQPGRVRGVGTGPTLSSLWGPSRDALRIENAWLNERVKELEERFARFESQHSNAELRGSSPVLSSMASMAFSKKELNEDNTQLQGKKIKVLDVDGQHVGTGICMSINKDKVVMGKQLGMTYCEVSVTFANVADASLFVKDELRKKMKDAVGTHILWLIDYVSVDTTKVKFLVLDEFDLFSKIENMCIFFVDQKCFSYAL